jgi:ribosome-associated translation inhibitor RaiA
MKIQLNTDKHIENNHELARRVEYAVSGAVDRFSQRITRLEVHLSDENSHKAGSDDKRCLMEARLAGLQPIAVRHQAPTLEQAIDGAASKLERAIDSRLGRIGKR